MNKLPVISWDISWSVTQWVTCFYRLIWLSEARTHISIIRVSAQFANQAEPILMKCPRKTSSQLNEGGKRMGFPHSCNHLSKQWRAFSYNHTEDGLQCTVTVPSLLWDYCEDWSHEQCYSWVYRHKGDTHFTFLMNIFNTEFQLEMYYVTILPLTYLKLETNVFISYKSSHLHKHFMCTVKNCHLWLSSSRHPITSSHRSYQVSSVGPSDTRPTEVNIGQCAVLFHTC